MEDERFWSRDLFCGIDVGRVLHLVIRTKPLASGRTDLVLAKTVDWDEAAAILRRYRPKATVIDALPETTQARQLQEMQPRGKFWLSYYVQQKRGTKNQSPSVWDWRTLAVSSDRTRTLDQMVEGFYGKLNTLAANTPPDYMDHLASIKRVEEENQIGEVLVKWINTGDDHFAHAENYCHMAMNAQGVGSWVIPPS